MDNATPAAFSAHDISRANMTVMSEQIVNQGIDVVLGNTHTAFSDKKWFMDSALYERGYKIIKDKDSLKSVKPGDRIWGKLPAAYYDVERAESTPNIAELTEAAIIALNDENENGFFLMVEGSAVDGGGHSNNVVNNVGEYLAFDAACKVAIEFSKSRNDTIVVIAPDHDTGGLYYNYEDLNKIVQDVQFGISLHLPIMKQVLILQEMVECLCTFLKMFHIRRVLTPHNHHRLMKNFIILMANSPQCIHLILLML